MRSKTIILFISLALAITLFAGAAYGSAGYATVTIPSFPITLNETLFDFRYDKYPFILYKDITYFPMTYKHCAYLGVAAEWRSGDGLYVAAIGSLSGNPPDYGRGNNKASSYKARIADFPIHVNGRLIDNSKEEYPLLVFRDVTYFPVTWRFATEELSWEISWGDGLEIRRVNTRGFDFIQEGRESVIILDLETVYGETLNPDGTVSYYSKLDKWYYARFNFSDESLMPLDAMPSIPGYNTGYAEADAGARIEGNSLYYMGEPIADISDLADIDTNSGYGAASGYPITLYSAITGFDGGYYLSVTVNYNNHIPPPYTPKRIYNFIAFEGTGLKRLDLGDNENMTRVAAVADGAYVSTLWYVRHWGAGYTLWFVSRDGSVINVNDKLKGYDYIQLIDVIDDTAYIKCLRTTRQDFMTSDFGLSVSLINDGYYKMGRDYSLSKIHPYVDAMYETLTPEGVLYAAALWRYGVINLTNGTFISLDGLPVSKIEYR